MTTDIVPELLENIEKDFNKSFKENKKLKNIKEMIDNGTATYVQANEYAVEVGTLLAASFKKNIKSSELPDEKMYYNIAERILKPTLSNNHEIVSQASSEIQQSLNKTIGLGLLGVKPKVNEKRIESIVNRITAEEVFDDVAWILGEPVVNFTQSVVDETIEANVDFQGESGLNPKIIRTAEGGDPCDWCKSLEGVYKYPNVPADVYKRHDRCRCTVEYDVSDTRKQNVWTKEWR